MLKGTKSPPSFASTRSAGKIRLVEAEWGFHLPINRSTQAPCRNSKILVTDTNCPADCKKSTNTTNEDHRQTFAHLNQFAIRIYLEIQGFREARAIAVDLKCPESCQDRLVRSASSWSNLNDSMSQLIWLAARKREHESVLHMFNLDTPVRF